MIKSLSMMNNVAEVCGQLRRKMYGKNATAKDFKDSYIINNCIDYYCGKPEDLMKKEISELDQSQGKTSKSVNFRSDSYKKLNTYSKILNVPGHQLRPRRIIIINHINSADVLF